MPDSTPPPLVALQEDGTPAIINYNVPEPTSYSGRNFIDLIPDHPRDSLRCPARRGHAGRLPAWPGRGLASSVAPAAPAAGGASTSLVPGLAVPKGVVVVPDGDPQQSPIMLSTQPVGSRLASLTRADIAALHQTGKQVVVYRSTTGALSYEVEDLSTPSSPEGATPLTTVLHRGVPMMQPVGGPLSDPPEPPRVSVTIDSPKPGPPLPGPSAGVTVPISGTWFSDAATVAIEVQADGGSSTPVPTDSSRQWSTTLTFTSSGSHRITVRASTQWRFKGQTRTVTATANVTVDVVLDQANPDPAPTLPRVQVLNPPDAAIITAKNGVAVCTVKGTASDTGGPGVVAVTVRVDGSETPVSATPHDGTDWSHWSAQVLLDGIGPHTIGADASDTNGIKAATDVVTVVVADRQDARRLETRLMIVETLNLSSFLGDYGAGRAVKTFSLLPGEKTTISIRTWDKSSTNIQNVASVVDSTAVEAGEDFDQALTEEATRKEAAAKDAKYSVTGQASMRWGFGSASLSATFSGSANSAREEAVKNVRSATRKHSMKASSNRSLTINTESQYTNESGNEQTTTREISNINVSRALNFVFRQMNQEHITLVHLTDARIGYYTLDVLLDADGKPQYRTDEHGQPTSILDTVEHYQEVTLPELDSLLQIAVVDVHRDAVRQAIFRVLTGIPDYQGSLRSLIEQVVPLDDNGAEMPEAAYFRVPPNLQTTFVNPHTERTITVPGIVLSYDHIVMRTDGVLVEAVLGEGDALDGYSHGLQDAAVAQRRIALDERRAGLDRQALARKIVAEKDAEAAAIYATVFPPIPASVPSTLTVGLDGQADRATSVQPRA